MEPTEASIPRGSSQKAAVGGKNGYLRGEKGINSEASESHEPPPNRVSESDYYQLLTRNTAVQQIFFFIVVEAFALSCYNSQLAYAMMDLLDVDASTMGQLTAYTAILFVVSSSVLIKPLLRMFAELPLLIWSALVVAASIIGTEFRLIS